MEHTSPPADSPDIVPPQFDAEITGPRAWTRTSLSPEDWLVPLPEACLAEFETLVAFYRQHPQPPHHLTPEVVALPACTALMAHVRHKLQHQVGFAVIDRLPTERYSTDESTAICWVLARLFGQVVSQKRDGTVLYNVKDSGQALGHGVRRSVTNLAQDFHTDGGWLPLPPEYIALCCLQPAHEGGISRCVSLLTVHNEMRHRHPELLPRLFQPFWWDRQAEHGPDEMPCSWQPIYQYDGNALATRYYEDYIHKGYRLAGATLDPQGAEALAAMRAIVDAPEHWVEFRVEQGQIEYLNNTQMAHARTAFRDVEDPRLRRHMIRLWNRNTGTPHLEGVPPMSEPEPAAS